MATALVAGDLLQVRMWVSDSDQASCNTVGYHVASVPTPTATDQDVADVFDANVSSNYHSICNQHSHYDGVQVLIVNRPTAVRTVFQTANAATNGGFADALPRQVAGLLQSQTALAGPKYRGRMYVPFLGTGNDDTNGHPTSATLALFSAFATLLFSPWTISSGGRTADLIPCIIHRAKRPTLPTFTQITSFSVSSRWATIRRRGDFGRVNVSPI